MERRIALAALLAASAIAATLILAKGRRAEEPADGAVSEAAASSQEPAFPGDAARPSRQGGRSRSPASAAGRRDRREGNSSGIAGVAHDGDTGSPLESFVVRIEVPQANRGWLARLLGSGAPRERSFGSPEGAFEILDLLPDLYTFRFEVEGYFPANLEDVPVRKGTVRRGLRVKLRRAATLEGTVVEEGSGTPVGGATVDVVSYARTSNFEGEVGDWRTLTGPDGRFRIRTKPGSMALRVTRDGFVDWTGEPIEVGAGETRTAIAVTLGRGGGIEGSVPGPAHAAAPGPWVSVVSEDPEASRSRGVLADAEGRFRILGLATGRYAVAAFPRAGPGDASPRLLRASVDVEEGRTSRVEFSATPGGGCVVRGRVSRKGEPVAGADVSIVRAPGGPGAALDPFAIPHGRRTGEDGTFAFEGVPPGEVSLRVLLSPSGRKEGALYAKTFPLLVPDSPECVFEAALPAGGISGRVYRASDGSPAPGVDVNAFQLDPAVVNGFVEAVFCGADARGRYGIVDLAPGEYFIRAYAHPPGRTRDPSGEPPASSFLGPVTVADSTVTLDIPLPEGGDLVVRVRDSLGRPVPSATVSLRHAESPREPGMHFDEWAEAEPGEAGVFRADGLRPGQYSAKVVARDHAIAFAEGWQVVEGEEAAFDVDLARGTRVLVKAVDEGAAPVPLIWVDVADPDGRPFRCFREVSGRPRAGEKGGIVVFLAPGEYLLAGGTGTLRGTATPVRVGGEAEQEVILRIGTKRDRR